MSKRSDGLVPSTHLRVSAQLRPPLTPLQIDLAERQFKNAGKCRTIRKTGNPLQLPDHIRQVLEVLHPGG